MKHLTRTGKIEYQIDHPDYPSGIWGFESFTLTHHTDGSRVVRAYCELDDDSKVIRDVIQRVDKDFHPQDAMVRLTVNDEFVGSTWYYFTDDTAELEGFTSKDGRIKDKTTIHRKMRGFGNHSLIGDAWMMAKVDLSKGNNIQTFKNNLITSLDHRGATGPAFERSASTDIQYFGQEEVTVRAGIFRCHHFAFVNLSNNHPPYHLWTTTDGDFIFVKGEVVGFNWAFELIDLI